MRFDDAPVETPGRFSWPEVYTGPAEVKSEGRLFVFHVRGGRALKQPGYPETGFACKVGRRPAERDPPLDTHAGKR